MSDEKKTVVKIEESQYGKLFGVYTCLGFTGDGKEITESKAISGKFGIKKAKAILSHVDELRAFVESESK